MSFSDLPTSPLNPGGVFPTTGNDGASDQEQPQDYIPDAKTKKLIDEINDKAGRWRRERQPHEQQWFINAAFFRGQQYVQWSDKDQRLTVPPAPAHRVRLIINRIFPKVRARIAKFLKNRPIPQVVPAMPDQEAKLNARATKKALDYQWRRLEIEGRYKDALMWAKDTGKAFWWFYWDPTLMARVSLKDPMSGEQQVHDAPLGDVCLEVGSAFEVLVADPGVSRLGDQPAIMRVKLRQVSEMKARYPDMAPYIRGDAGMQDMFRYEKQIASLNNVGYGGTGLIESRFADKKNNQPDLVLVKEYFERPGPSHPEGRYAVLCGEVLVRGLDEMGQPEPLPYKFSDLRNPYPAVAFSDVETAGQFWGPTVTEQLIGLQREYNLVRSKVAEQLRVMAFPKLLAAKQHQIADGAWTSEAGEFIEYIALPGVPPPTPWFPPNIAADAWKAIDLIQREFDDITHIYPASEGEAGQATSGFQTNLLQEATDSVHQPDIRAHEVALEDAAVKIRRLMKTGYDVPRLLSTIGHNYEPEVMEFSSDQIDEAAIIEIQAASALPDLKGARIQAILQLFTTGVLGDPNDPDVKRRALAMLEMGELDEAYDYARRDDELARIENTNLEERGQIAAPEFYQNHNIHYQVHTDQLKNVSTNEWNPEFRKALLQHVVQHVDFINPQSALELCQQYGFPVTPHAAQLQQQQQQAQQQAAQQQQQQAAAQANQPQAQPQQPLTPQQQMQLEQQKLASQHQIGMAKATQPQAPKQPGHTVHLHNAPQTHTTIGAPVPAPGPTPGPNPVQPPPILG